MKLLDLAKEKISHCKFFFLYLGKTDEAVDQSILNNEIKLLFTNVTKHAEWIKKKTISLFQTIYFFFIINFFFIFYSSTI